MARGGISKALVEQARDALIAKGLRPTIDAVRIELGNTGSKTTISRYLKELSESEGGRLDDVELLSENLKDIVIRLARQLRNEAAEIVELAESRHKNEIHRSEAKIAELQQSLDKSLANLTNRDNELSDEKKAHRVTEEQLIELKTQIRENAKLLGELEIRVKEKDQLIQSLESMYQHARESLEHFRQSAKEQRDQDIRQHGQQIQQLQADARQHAQTLIVKQNEVTQLNKDNARLATELKESHRESSNLKHELQTTSASLSDLIVKQAKLESDLSQMHEKYNSLQIGHSELLEQYDATLQRLDDKESAIVQLEVRIETQAALFKDIKESIVYSKISSTPVKPNQPE
jgi:chromosome segregation ATPase